MDRMGVVRYPVTEAAGNRASATLVALSGEGAVLLEEIEYAWLPAQGTNAFVTLGRTK